MKETSAQIYGRRLRRKVRPKLFAIRVRVPNGTKIISDSLERFRTKDIAEVRLNELTNNGTITGAPLTIVEVPNEP